MPMLSKKCSHLSGSYAPERVADNEKCDVVVLGVLQDLVRTSLDAVAVREDHFTLVELAL